MIELLPIKGRFFSNYCEINGKNQDYVNDVEKTVNTIRQEDCNRLLLIGKVQSGKTSHFIGASLLMFDSGYQTGIIFSGTKINLHNQTIERFHKEYEGLKINIISDNDKNIEHQIRNNNLNIIVCLKHPSRINKLNQYSKYFGKLFIVDDESDQASLNALNKENIIKNSVKFSATHDAIQNLIVENSPKYFQITATPAGHLLTGLLDYFKPNYLLALKSHKNYFGNKELFENKKSIIRWIDDDPKNPSRSFLTQFLLQHFENSYKLELNRPDISNISAFIHPHNTIKILSNYFVLINIIIQNLIDNVDNFIFENNLHITEFFKANKHDIISNVVLKTRVTLAAGKHDKTIIWNEYFKNYKHFILIGGSKLERGFTIEGLISTYMPRSQKVGNADTIQQRARFFGSKMDLIEYITVYFNEKTYEDFKEYYENEEYILQITQNPIKASEFNYTYITDFTNPCRTNILYNSKILIGTHWKHYFIPLQLEVFNDDISKIGFKKYYKLLGNYETLIYSVDKKLFINQLNKYEFLSFSNQLDNKFGSISLLESTKSDELEMIILGNELQYRIRTAVVKEDNYIPESVHQGHGPNYPGDRNILNTGEITVQISFIKLRDLDKQPLMTISIKQNDEN